MTQQQIGFQFTGGDLTPVILLHCSLSNKSQWRSLSKILQSNFSTLGIDLIGYGENPQGITQPFSLNSEVNYIENLIKKLGVGKRGFHVIGHSYGGAVALKLAHKYPSQVLSLTLFEPVSFHLLPDDSTSLKTVKSLAQKIEALIREGSPIEATELFINYWSGEGTFGKLTPPMRSGLVKNIRKVCLDFQALLRDTLLADDLNTLPFVCHLIAGKNSKQPTIDIINLLRQKLIYSTLDWVDGGHMAPVSHPALVNKVVYQYLLPELVEYSHVRA